MSSEILGPGKQPRNKIEEIGSDALNAIRRSVADHNGVLEKAIVGLWVRDVGLPDSVLCADNVDDPRDLFSFLIAEAISVGEQLGLSLKIVKIGQG